MNPKKPKRVRLGKKGFGNLLPGDVINPKGNIETMDHPKRYQFNAKPGEVRNPYGRYGYKGQGLLKPGKLTNEGARSIMEHRELQEKCRQEAEDALEELRRIYKSDTAADTAKLSAISMILDRAYGKATQTNVNAQVNGDGKPSEVDEAELNRRIKDALKRVEAATSGEGQPSLSEDGPSDLRKLN